MEKETGQERVLSPQELRALQKVLLEMLVEVDRICKKNKIRYYLEGGTLLGAVRHKGFIPWDDDLDITLLREEYVKLRTACLKDLNSEKYFFQDNTTDPEYPWGYGRIRRKNSEFVRLGQEHLKMKTGIFLDIFPRDNVPNFYPLRAMHCFYAFALRKTLYARVGCFGAKNGFLRQGYQLLNKIPLPFVFRRLDHLAKFWNQRATRYARCLTFPYFSGPIGKGRFGYYRHWYTDEPAYIEFEGTLFPVTPDYKNYLTCLYGDYMTLPPPEKRHWHPAAKFQLPRDDIEKRRGGHGQ